MLAVGAGLELIADRSGACSRLVLCCFMHVGRGQYGVRHEESCLIVVRYGRTSKYIVNMIPRDFLHVEYPCGLSSGFGGAEKKNVGTVQ